jgi:hypothetical protein
MEVMTYVAVIWTVVYLMWDRCVCDLDCGVLSVGQMGL